ncbi:MAG: methylated-DNA--[protein]-cysteine S-methyltransferase [Candidatus Marinimicrobia bacterium]|jgi:methylated-DNA-[protein]-cysteine S-methyltransferase|nr:methylated-DNA--[protein]-cysteine S-methyltransferase [Candidatus Neomarinimicrobiota bacterium]MBT3500814.1 methylated-DNA--[protein]-cysteine S-methyltransferase [Candidatus Neomarinimicrobiota bacterium]MBT3838848.1 methylated-DNA--[protein]-cysteine S-methyltransferase [Candidatus Neomarinimicrobiota bacterium]MBT3998825.1 methylated-DNA--[protein]-cysteine S-methyltransferase [Candidatus Neomarinimicrobiota bacterium]MBT4282856.1 methylated-DNA--[protein]-cysteine S-methyltransferase [
MNEYAKIKTPIGTLGIRTNDRGVYRVHLANDIIQDEPQTSIKNRSPLLNQTLKELQEYFNGTRKDFTVPLDLKMPPFYKKSLLEVAKIPFGKTVSYQEIAKRAGNEKASRAAGSANANNPIAILIPCHRVLTSNGTLGGYGGGLDKKMILLTHEGIDVKL